MKMRFLRKSIPALVCSALLLTGCATGGGDQAATDKAVKPAAAAKQAKNVYKGKVVGKSNKAKQISIQVGKGAKAKTIMVSFDDIVALARYI